MTGALRCGLEHPTVVGVCHLVCSWTSLQTCQGGLLNLAMIKVDDESRFLYRAFQHCNNCTRLIRSCPTLHRSWLLAKLLHKPMLIAPGYSSVWPYGPYGHTGSRPLSFEAVAQSLRSNCCLQELYLQHNEICDPGAEAPAACPEVICAPGVRGKV